MEYRNTNYNGNNNDNVRLLMAKKLIIVIIRKQANKRDLNNRLVR